MHSKGYRIPITNWILETDYDTYSVRYSCYNKSSDSHRKSRNDNEFDFILIIILYSDRDYQLADSRAVSQWIAFI